MAALTIIKGHVRETGNSVIGQNFTEYGTVVIEKEDGTIVHVRRGRAPSLIPNGLHPGTKGTFYFLRNMNHGQTLVALEENGEFIDVEMGPLVAYGLTLTVVTLPLLLVVIGFAVFPNALAFTIRAMRASSEMKQIKSALGKKSGVRMLTPQII